MTLAIIQFLATLLDWLQWHSKVFKAGEEKTRRSWKLEVGSLSQRGRRQVRFKDAAFMLHAGSSAKGRS